MRKVRTILDADELLDVAFRRAARVNAKENLAKVKVATASSLIAARLQKIVKGFPSLDNIHPFHREMLDVIVGLDELKHALGAADWCASQVETVGRRFSGSDVKAPYGRMSSFVKQISKELKFLQDAAQKLNAIPDIEPTALTVIIAGPPNVGKSSLVAKWSSAKPKVASYPFTTKELSVGHTIVKGHKIQIIDTPGLLDRPMEKRNPIEKQAVLALTHLDAVVLFLIDPSGTCGYDLEYQERVLDEVKASFPSGKILVVDSKADIAKTGRRLALSAMTGKGTEEVWSELVAMLDLASRPEILF